MPSIKVLTRLSAVSLFGIHLFIESIAYPVLEKDHVIKIIKPRLFSSGGKTKPLLGGVLLGGGGILAYNSFKGDSKSASVIAPSQPLSSSNGGPTGDPFASAGITDPALGDPALGEPGVDASAGTGGLPGVGAATGVGAGAGALPGVGAANGVGAGASALPGAVPGTVPGANVGTGTFLVKKDVIWRGEYGTLVPRMDSIGSSIKSGLGGVATVVVGNAVLNFVSGIVNGRRERKAQQALRIEAAAVELGTEPEMESQALDSSNDEFTLPSKPDLMSKSRRPIEEDQTE